MSTKSIYHYVYRITNLIENKHYYGSRTCKGINPIEDLGIKYISSSHDIDFICEQKDHPENFKYKIIRIFNTRYDANLFEIYIHEKFDVKNNDNFYNRVNATTDIKDLYSYITNYGSGTTGLAIVKDENGNIFSTPKDNPEIGKSLVGATSGLIRKVPAWIGKHHNKESIDKMKETHIINKHQKGETNSQYGTRWIYNLVLKKSKKINKEDVLLEGWLEGRKIKF